ncbi:putative PAPS reductase/DUF3440 domain-containing protein YbdN (plasmid) [Rhodovastum atsumiense]|uniref:DUF3440 domain-containing protein n=1 Tax=Rhodovastum atsumiense TaxID=504468 RepID=A0A5M6IU16_9PROT|nr:DUF3440 domain-containing protein [Rhodovastum atsumiense]KAA5611813.1 DUF3440 domain-containing protein [Rhodovastum atsumiense]CAH2606078.1 putative PAPS reductase/DUF3440 domain-containing protein YbdN [Rhodovastum atsumiense]
MGKRYLDIDVLTAAKERIAWTFDRFPERLYVSFSGGKDSTVLMHLACAEARRRGRRIGLLFIDWEAQMEMTIAHVRHMLAEYADCIEPHWICLPLRTTNACSQIEPEWAPWDPAKRDIWVREMPPEAFPADRLPFFKPHDTFEEFVRDFAVWYSGGKPTACLLGIRGDEASTRYMDVVDRGGRDRIDPDTGEVVRIGHERLEGRSWTVKLNLGTADAPIYNCSPIYDWRTEDLFTYLGKFGLAYNPLYDMMHKAGLKLSQMRICEPYGDEQRKGLWLYHIVEPETWQKVVNRVAGANTGALYSRERGNVAGVGKVRLPPNMPTWKAYAEFLLDTMPHATAEHYRSKIATWLRYYQQHGYPDLNIPDSKDGDTGVKDVASWRRVCKCLMRNDYWCKTIGFSPTKTQSYERYQRIMARRREEWGIMASGASSEAASTTFSHSACA